MPLSVSHVSFAYPMWSAGSERAMRFSLRDLSMRVERGSVTGLLGPNGCGKSTLLKLCAGIVRPDQGRVTFDGTPIGAWPKRTLAQRLALVPQDTHPAFDFTALELALMGRHPYLGPFRLEGPSDIAIASDALATTGTAHLAGRLFSTLSGGEKQRVVIASALAQEPEVLLLDEPTASLDLAFELEVVAVLERLNRERGVTLVMATHDLNLAAAICDTLIVMRSGQVRAHGPTHEVLTSGMIEDVYNVEAGVHRDETSGHLMVVPYRRRK